MEQKIKQHWDAAAFLKQNYAFMTIPQLEEAMGISEYRIRNLAKSLRLKKTEKQRRLLRGRRGGWVQNPNPVTATTWMLVCRYDYEGLSRQEICRELGRSTREVEDILKHSRANGNYRRVNRYGR